MSFGDHIRLLCDIEEIDAFGRAEAERIRQVPGVTSAVYDPIRQRINVAYTAPAYVDKIVCTIGVEPTASPRREP